MSYMLLLVISMGLPFLISNWLKSTYNKYSKVGNTANLTGAEVAQAMLEANNIHDVKVEAVAGQLSDHYDPRSKVVRLSEGNYGVASVAAMAVAAHEVGHAIQHNIGYKALQTRTALLVPSNIGQRFGPILIMIAIFLPLASLKGPIATVGIILFSMAALFQLATLPVEFDASKRALSEMKRLGYATEDDTSGARSVLNAAAMTYVAGLAATIATIFYYVSILRR